MHKTIQTALALVGITLGLAITPAMAQSDGDSKMKMSGMTDKNKMTALGRLDRRLLDVDQQLQNIAAGEK